VLSLLFPVFCSRSVVIYAYTAAVHCSVESLICTREMIAISMLRKYRFGLQLGQIWKVNESRVLIGHCIAITVSEAVDFTIGGVFAGLKTPHIEFVSIGRLPRSLRAIFAYEKVCNQNGKRGYHKDERPQISKTQAQDEAYIPLLMRTVLLECSEDILIREHLDSAHQSRPCYHAIFILS
jgi:hypothetical protein